MHGRMTLNAVRGGVYEVFGGPYMKKPRGMRGLCMAAELAQQCSYTIAVPTVDFQTPPPALLLKGIDEALDLLIQGEPLYVGCAGGIGRTGLFLAALAKVWGEKNPVKYVRAEYIPNAVETEKQVKFIKGLKIPWALRMKAFRAKMKSLIGPRNKKLTRTSHLNQSVQERIQGFRDRAFCL